MIRMVRSVVKSFRIFFTLLIKKIKMSIYNTYGDCKKGISLFTRIMISTLGSMVITSGAVDNKWLIYLLLPVILIVFLVVTLGEILCKYIVSKLFRYQITNFILVLILFYGVYILQLYGDTSNNAALTATFLFVSIYLSFSYTFWAVVRNKRRNVISILSFLFALSLFVCSNLFLVGEGFKNNIYKEYVEQISLAKEPTKRINYEEKYEINSVSYGSDADVVPRKTHANLASYTYYNGKITEWLRNSYWGTGLKEMPIRGRIWYPVEGGNYPVLFIIHGNHTMVTPSYLGYDYLGESLAKCGYVVVSVDESFLNGYIDYGLVEENDARAILLLENIKEIIFLNEQKNSILYQKINPDKIAISGHSRGGEAAAIAALFSDYDVSPDNGQTKLYYNYNIKTVIAIAPCCDQYKPGDREVELQDVNYFLIHGSHDMDVTEFMGMKQYQNVTFTGKDNYRKAYLYIAGANHGQFNSKWGRYDIGLPSSMFLNTASLLEEKDQEEILIKYMKVCLDVSLKEQYEQEDFLMNCEPYANDLPNTVYVQGYQNSSFQTICNYEEDSRIDTGSIENSKIYALNMMWSEVYTRFTDVSNDVNSDTDNYAAKLRWNTADNPQYVVTLLNTESNLRYLDANYLQFDVVDYDVSSIANGEYKALDFDVIIRYEDGTTEEFTIGDYKTIYPPIAVRLSKADYMFGEDVYKHQFQTIQLPLKQGGIKIESIQFRFLPSKTGAVMLDNIGLSN